MKIKHLLCLLAFGLCSGVISAHHSFAIYDIDQKIQRTGVLKKLQFSNPHIQLVLEIDHQGKRETWQIESMNTQRWDESVKTRAVATLGETVTITGWPARNGELSMLLSAIDSPSHGKTLVLNSVKQSSARNAAAAIEKHSR